MTTEKTYDVFMACGFGFRDVIEKADIGTRLLVNTNDGSVKGVPKGDDGSTAKCWNCSVIRKAKMKEQMFFSEADKIRGSRPTGKMWSCVVARTVDH